MRNEEQHIAKMLRSALPHCSHAVICDTGSDDGTLKIVEDILDEHPNIEGTHVPYGDEWVNFSHNRNLAIERARKTGADWMLLLDGDEELIVEKPTLEECTSTGAIQGDPHGFLPSGYNVQHGEAFRWFVPRLVRLTHNSLEWHYVGACHEYLTASGIDTKNLPILPGVSIRHLEDGSRSEAKIARNLELLGAEWNADNSNPRTAFYLAQTYFDLQAFSDAARLYKRRIEIGGWSEETFYAMYRLAKCTKSEHDYMAAFDFRPSRVEPLLDLARQYRDAQQFNSMHMITSWGMSIPMTKDILFVDAQAYEWGMPLEHGIACMATGRVKDAVNTFAQLTGKPGPAKLREAAQNNLKLALAKLN